MLAGVLHAITDHALGTRHSQQLEDNFRSKGNLYLPSKILAQACMIFLWMKLNSDFKGDHTCHCLPYSGHDITTKAKPNQNDWQKYMKVHHIQITHISNSTLGSYAIATPRNIQQWAVTPKSLYLWPNTGTTVLNTHNWGHWVLCTW